MRTIIFPLLIVLVSEAEVFAKHGKNYLTIPVSMLYEAPESEKKFKDFFNYLHNFSLPKPHMKYIILPTGIAADRESYGFLVYSKEAGYLRATKIKRSVDKKTKKLSHSYTNAGRRTCNKR